MNQRSDTDGLLRHWLADGPSTMPDRVVDVVADRISRQPQRRAWRLQGRLTMSPAFKYAIAAAAVLVVALIGFNLLPGNRTGGPNTTPSSPPSAQATPTPALVRTLPEGVVTAGRYSVRPFSSPDERLTVEMTVPDGWSGIGGWALASPEGLGGPKGLGLAFLRPEGLFSDPCHWDALGTGQWPQPPDVPGGETAAELVTALMAQTAYEVGDRADVTIGGYPGTHVTLDLPDADLTTCDSPAGRTAAYLVFGASDAFGSNLYAQGRDQNWHLWILDLPRTRIVIVVDDYPGTNLRTHDAAVAIVESMTFTP